MDGAVAPVGVDERAGLGSEMHVAYGAEQDAVGAETVRIDKVALQGGCGATEHRWRRRFVQPVAFSKPILAAVTERAGEPHCERIVARREHVEAEPPRRDDRLAGRRRAVDREQHRHRID